MGFLSRRGGSGLIVELAAIFVGVLIALTAESVWQQRQDVARADAYVRIISRDMVEAQTQVDRGIERGQIARDQATAVLELIRAAEPPPDSITGGLMSGYGPVIPMGTLRALLETGDVNLLGSEALRAAIVGRTSLLERDIRVLEMLKEQGFKMYSDLIRARVALRAEEGLPPGAIPIAAVRRSPDVIGLYEVYQNWQGNRLATMRFLKQNVQFLQEAIALELGPS